VDSIELFLIGVAIVHLILVIFALKDLFTIAKVKLIGKILWIIIIIYPMVVGPLIYLHYGRGERSWNIKVRELQKRALEIRSENDESIEK